jgi:hypothetical protein
LSVVTAWRTIDIVLSAQSERERLESEAAPAPSQPAPVLGAGLTPASVLALQRAGAGNHAIARILARSGGYVSNTFAALGGQQQQKPKQAQKVQSKPQTPRAQPKLQQAVSEPVTSFVQTQKLVKPKWSSS